MALSCGALLAVGAAPASAAISHKFEFSFNGSGAPDGPYSGYSIGTNAIDQVNPAVYVFNFGAGVVDKFNPNGTYAGVQILGSSTPATSFSSSFSSGVAVDNSGLGADPSNGDVYVADSGNGVVDKFTSSGTFVCQISGQGSASTDPTHECSTSAAGVGSIQPRGLAVDAAGNLYVADGANNAIDVFDPTGEYKRQITDSHITTPGTIALDSSGNLYVANLFSNVAEFNASTGAFVRELDSGHNPLSVGVDPTTAHVYVGRFSELAEYDSSGNLLDTFGSGRSSFVLGLAVRSSGEVYVDNFGNGEVDVYGPDAIIPDVTATAATQVEQFAATLNGTVDPAGGGNVESCEFEYGTTESYGQAAPCSPATPYAGVTSVSAGVSGLQPETTYHFRVAASNSNGIVNHSSDLTFTTPAVAVTGQATNLTVSSATLNGTVNPDGATITDCRFEYGKTAGYGHFQPCAESGAQIGTGTSPVPVHADLTDLAENTSYHFRLVVAYTDGSNTGSNDGTDERFTTLSRPQIDTAYTANLTASSVDLNAEINPKGLDTTYYFEWGTDRTYGNQSAEPPGADIGLGTSDVPVTQHLEGLSANTVYHWRVVADNSVGTTTGQDHTFVYQATTPSGAGCSNAQLRTNYSSNLPDCRAYEQVSPVDKNGNDVKAASALIGKVEQQASVDGGGIFYEAVGAFPGAQSGSPYNQYLASRGASGWSTRAVSLPQPRGLYNTEGGFHHTDYYLPLSPDLSTGVLQHAEPALVAGAPTAGWNLYVGQLDTGSYQLVTNVAPPNQTGGGVYGKGFAATFQGASADFSHVIFTANDALTPDAPYPDNNLYEWVGGQLRLVGQIPTSGTSCTGAECIPANGSEAGAGTGFFNDSYAHAISADGSRIVFSTGSRFSGGRHIYDRLNGTTTVDVSGSQRIPPEPGAPDAAYQDASVDGSHVLFTSEGALTNDAVSGSGVNLYDYDVETGQLTDLTAVADARVQGLVEVSEDGSYVYFVAEGRLAANSNSPGDVAVAGQPNLYLRHGARTTFIATLNPGDSHVWTHGPSTPARVTPDGAHLAFDSLASLTGYDNTDANTGEPDRETYLYEAAANRLRCASCNPSGARPIGPSAILYSGSELYALRNLSPDGSRLFLTSRDALLPADTNGLNDIYEWEADGSGSCHSSADNGGCLYLISSGRGASNSYFADASASGNDAFFSTSDRLVGSDHDDYTDLYDARVGGGFPEPPPPAPCEGESCRGAGSSGEALSAGSANFEGPGNPHEKPCPKGKVRRHGHCVKARKQKRRHQGRAHHRSARRNRRAGK